jgi:hypothetical protein
MELSKQDTTYIGFAAAVVGVAAGTFAAGQD